MQKTCLQCNKVFEKQSTRSRRDFLERCKFCSKNCYNLSMKGVTLSEERKSLLRGRVAHNRKPMTEFNCAKCNVFVSKLTGEVNKETKIRFCTKSCADAFRNHGKTSAQKLIRESSQYKKWRISVFTRDNYTCQECGERGGELNADHIKSFAFFPELRLELSNGRTLCVECHRKTETYGGRAVSYYKKTLWANAV